MARKKKKNTKSLSEKIKNSVNNLNKGIYKPTEETEILSTIRNLKFNNSDQTTRLDSAQWIVLHHMMKIMRCENTNQAEAAIKSSKSDLPLAIKLLDCEFDDEKMKTQKLLLQADIYQKLTNFIELKKCYNEILKDLNSFQMKLVALTIAPSLSDWKKFNYLVESMKIDLKDKWEYKKGDKDDNFMITELLHQYAECGTPDLGLIYKLAKNQNIMNNNCPDPKELFSITIPIKEIKLKIIKIKTDTKDKENEIMESIKDMKDFKLDDNSLTITGGLVAFPGLSIEIQMLLVGPYISEDNLILEGYVDLQMQDTDENGNPKMDMQALYDNMMSNISPEMVAAIQSGQMKPEALQNIIQSNMMQSYAGGQADFNSLGSIPNNSTNTMRDGLQGARQGMPQMPTNEQLDKIGILVVRQHERLEIQKTKDGYSGLYIIKNYSPDDENKDNRKNETSITFSIEMFCDHIKSNYVEDPVGSIETGIDNLVLG